LLLRLLDLTKELLAFCRLKQISLRRKKEKGEGKRTEELHAAVPRLHLLLQRTLLTFLLRLGQLSLKRRESSFRRRPHIRSEVILRAGVLSARPASTKEGRNTKHPRKEAPGLPELGFELAHGSFDEEKRKGMSAR